MTQPARLPLLKGSLDLLVLRALNWSPMHGFEIVTWLERAANGSLEIEDSAFFEAIEGLIERRVFDLEAAVRGALEPGHDLEPVHRRPVEGAEHEEVERSLEERKPRGLRHLRPSIESL